MDTARLEYRPFDEEEIGVDLESDGSIAASCIGVADRCLSEFKPANTARDGIRSVELARNAVGKRHVPHYAPIRQRYQHPPHGSQIGPLRCQDASGLSCGASGVEEYLQ